MRAVIQRVKAAKVTVMDELVSSIGPGLCVLVGIKASDTSKDVEYL
ncbi:D-aminoacyl-tRNA deacylase isoform X3 [Drosophila gunungcola]|nr:D-aminoacyl-tRNA deacylase isoform X3 [Drosophila gunungcola]